MLSPEDLKQIVDGVALQMATRCRENHAFQIPPQEHYNQHQRLDRVLNLFEYCENQVLKVALAAFCFVGLLIAAVVSWVRQ